MGAGAAGKRGARGGGRLLLSETEGCMSSLVQAGQKALLLVEADLFCTGILIYLSDFLLCFRQLLMGISLFVMTVVVRNIF